MTRVLVIEDSPTQLQQYISILEDEGFEVAAALDADRGFALLEKTPFDLVVSDIVLTGTDGFELCRRIKTNPASRQVPVILLTRWADPANVLRGLEAGADGFITKGREPAEIARRVHRVLARPRENAAATPTTVNYFDQHFQITAPREQLLEVLLLAFEDQVQIDKRRQEELMLRKQAEQALRHLNNELEQRVADRTADLARANQSLAQRNQENELFVYSVSHDLRSPLVNLQGFTSELGRVCKEIRSVVAGPDVAEPARKRIVDLMDQDIAESLHFIQSAVLRLSNIIDALLKLSRAGRVEYRFEMVDVAPIVGHIVASMTRTAAEHKASVTVKELAPVWCDARAVEQIFANLIGNALNYLDPNRPGTIEIGMKELPPPPAASAPIALRAFYVKDNGLGIPKAYSETIFKAFQRAHPGVATGEGIGLTLVSRIMDRLGGKIWFESAEGEGTTFFVTLPVAKPAAAT